MKRMSSPFAILRRASQLAIVAAACVMIFATNHRPLAADTPATPASDTSIQPFHYHASDESLADLRRRVGAARWPENETVADHSVSEPLATMKKVECPCSKATHGNINVVRNVIAERTLAIAWSCTLARVRIEHTVED
jgi:hypothetical protein